jgi:hypothetical protein
MTMPSIRLRVLGIRVTARVETKIPTLGWIFSLSVLTRSVRFPGREESFVVISTIGQASVFAGTVAISLWASAASSQAAAPVKGEVKYVPMESISL